MNHVTTKAIILRRIDYQEADRIVRLLTPDQGKISVIAKGVRRPKSKLAGGIELFSTNDITYIKGRTDLSTLASTRTDLHFPNILKDIERVNVGYTCIKKIDSITEDYGGGEYYDVLHSAMAGLNEPELSLQLIELWFLMHIFMNGGRSPELMLDDAGKSLRTGKKYAFNYDSMAFGESELASFTEGHIKLLRLCQQAPSPKKLAFVHGIEKFTSDCLDLCRNIDKTII